MKRKVALAWFMSLMLACFVAANAGASTITTFDFNDARSNVGFQSGLQNYMNNKFGGNVGITDLGWYGGSSLFGSDALYVFASSGYLNFDTAPSAASLYEIQQVSFKWGVYNATSGIDFGLDVYDDSMNGGSGGWRSNVFTVNSNSYVTGQSGPITFDSAWQVTALKFHDGGYMDVGVDDLTISDNRPGNGIVNAPEPGTMMLLGSGLVGLAVWGRKKVRK